MHPIEYYIKDNCNGTPKYSEVYYTPAVTVGTRKIANRKFENQKIKFIYITSLIINLGNIAAILPQVFFFDNFGREIFRTTPSTATLFTGTFVFNYVIPGDRVIIQTQLGLAVGSLININFSVGYQLIEDFGA